MGVMLTGEAHAPWRQGLWDGVSCEQVRGVREAVGSGPR